jgi:hypothetical protein
MDSRLRTSGRTASRKTFYEAIEIEVFTRPAKDNAKQRFI